MSDPQDQARHLAICTTVHCAGNPHVEFQIDVGRAEENPPYHVLRAHSGIVPSAHVFLDSGQVRKLAALLSEYVREMDDADGVAEIDGTPVSLEYILGEDVTSQATAEPQPMDEIAWLKSNLDSALADQEAAENRADWLQRQFDATQRALAVVTGWDIAHRVASGEDVTPDTLHTARWALAT